MSGWWGGEKGVDDKYDIKSKMGHKYHDGNISVVLFLPVNLIRSVI